MRIGIDGRQLKAHRTGVGNYVYEIIKKLNQLDKENTYIIYSNKDVVIDFELNNNWEISVEHFKVGTYWLYYLLPKKIFNDKLDIFWGTQHFLPKRNKYTKNIKYVVTIHDLAIQKIKKVGSYYNTLLQKMFLKKSIRNSDKIITISNSTKKDLIDIYKVPDNKIKVIYIANSNNSNIKITKKLEKEIQKKWNIKPREFFLFLSTIEPRKNVNTIIKAFEEYNSKYPNVKLVLAGGIGWRCKDTINLINQSPCKKNIILTGYVTNEEKEYLLKNAICLLFPSLYEGFGIPVLEAFQNQLLVITSNISSLPEVGGDAAFYINDIYSYSELEKTMEKLYKLDDKLKIELIEKMKKQLMKFDWQKTANETLNFFKEV